MWHARRGRQLVAVSSLFVLLMAIALPARAGLGDLIEGAIEEVVELPVVTNLPLDLPTVTLPDVTLPEITVPLVTLPAIEVELPAVSTPEISIPIPIVEDLLGPIAVPSIDISPPTVEVNPDGTIEFGNDDPLIETGAEDPPVVEEGGALSEIHPELPIRSTLGSPTSGPIADHLQSPDTTSERDSSIGADLPLPNRVIGLEILQSISEPPEIAADRHMPRISALRTAASPLSWLSTLGTWLEQNGIAYLLAIPAHLFSLLLRALGSAGAGLVAPASILLAWFASTQRKVAPITH